MKKKTTSKRPSNNFDNSFAKAIFKSNFMVHEEEEKRRGGRTTSKKSNSDINNTPPIEGEEGAEAR